MDKVLWLRGLVLVGLFGLLAFLLSPVEWQEQVASVFGSSGEEVEGGLLTVAFLDVGQGDAIYIETPDGVQMLIDGGPDIGVLKELSSVMPLFDRTLDVVLATHSDLDHIGGLVDVLERYQVDNIARTENKNDTSVAELFSKLESEEAGDLHIVKAGQQLQLGASTTLSIISPQGDPREWESNTASVVAQLEYQGVAFMFTGDAPIGIEDYLVNSYGSLLKSDVLKLGHHGSKTSSGEAFLQMVEPDYAIVSAGADNSYGHPHTEVVDRVSEVGAEILNTAEVGTIIFKSNGERIWLER